MDAARAIVSSGIACMGHVGLTPQSVSAIGGFRPQAQRSESALHTVQAAQVRPRVRCTVLGAHVCSDAGNALVMLSRTKHSNTTPKHGVPPAQQAVSVVCAGSGICGLFCADPRVRAGAGGCSAHGGGTHPHDRHWGRAALLRPGVGLPRPTRHDVAPTPRPGAHRGCALLTRPTMRLSARNAAPACPHSRTLNALPCMHSEALCAVGCVCGARCGGSCGSDQRRVTCPYERAQVTPKFCKQYAHVGVHINHGLEAFRHEVEAGAYPDAATSPYKMGAEELEMFCELLESAGLEDSAEAALKPVQSAAEAVPAASAQ